MLAERLKDYTRSAHNDLEKKLISQIRKIKTADQYASLLLMMYGYYQPLENALTHFFEDSGHSGMPERRKASNILNDLEQLNIPHKPTPVLSAEVPQIDSYPRALGAMYVLEGSTLGGEIIAKMIGKQLCGDYGKIFSFFNPYADKTREMWKDFKQNLDQPFNENDSAAIMDAANETFITFKKWIEQHEPGIDQ